MGLASMMRGDAFVEAREDVLERGRPSWWILMEERAGVAGSERGVSRLVAQAGEVPRHGVGDLATHLPHGRVVEVQRMRGAQRPFAFPFAFAVPADLLPFLAAAARTGFEDFAAAFAGLADFRAAFADAAAFTGFAVLAAGAATTGAAGFAGGAAGGRAGARELVLSGGRGCLRGRPLLRAA